MAKTLNCSTVSESSFNYKNSDDIGDPVDKDRIKHRKNLTSGTASGLADLMYRARRTVAPNTVNDDLDLAGGLTDVFGATLTFVKVKEVLVINLGDPSGTTWTENAGSKLSVGGAGAAGNAWGGPFDGDQDAKVLVEDGSHFHWTSRLTGETVTAGTGDILRIAHDSGTTEIEYDIVIIGTSA